MIKRIILYLLLLIFLLLFLRVSFLSGIDADELEHTHVSWLLNNDVLPYKDIHQIHLPLLWIISSVFLKILPENSSALLFFRAFTLLFFFLTVWVGGKILKEILRNQKYEYLLSYYLLMIILTLTTEFYKFRPDPFMSFFAIAGIFFLLQSKSVRFFCFLSGLFFGISLSFSVKMFPLLFLFPLVNYRRVKKGRFVDFIKFNIIHYLGLILGILPFLLWLFYKGIFNDFYSWVIVNNLRMSGAFFTGIKYIIEFFLLTFLLSFLYRKYFFDYEKIFIVSTAFLLSFLIRIFDPNHLAYNWQMFVILMGCVFLFLLSEIKGKYFGVILIVIIAVLINIPDTIKAVGLKTGGWTVPPRGIDVLVSWKGDRREECVGFLPYHPVFCKDSTQLYLLWDYFFILKDWVSPGGKRVYEEMWHKAIREIVLKKPKIIVAPRFFKLAYENRILRRSEFNLFYNFTEKNYEKRFLGKIMVFVRREQEERND